MTDGTEPAIRASNREREAVIARLNAAVGEGRLDIEEFSERVELAYASRTRQELEPLTADLPATTDRTVVAAAPAGRPEHLTPIGSVKRSGAWRLERDSQLGVVAGTVKLDLRHAFLAAPDVTLSVSVVLGTIKVTVPEGVRVEVIGTTRLGTRKIEESAGTMAQGAPVLRLRLDTVVGTVKVYRR